MSLRHIYEEEPDDSQPLVVYPTLTFNVETVTPAMAKAALERNETNRPFKRHKINTYGRDMAAGQWHMTGEAIKFCKHGNLKDGQNRCAASIQFEASFTTLIARGIPCDAQNYMDSGAPRTTRDTLVLNGYKSAAVVGSTLTAYAGWSSGLFKHAMYSGQVSLSHAETLALLEERPELYESASFAKAAYRYLKLPSGAIGAAHYVLNRINSDDCTEFFGRMAEMRTAGKGDPIYTLLKKDRELHELGSRKAGTRPATGLFYLFRTWNACRAQETLDYFQLGSSLRGYVKIPEPR